MLISAILQATSDLASFGCADADYLFQQKNGYLLFSKKSNLQAKFCNFRKNHQTFRRSFAISEKIAKPSDEVLPFPKKSPNLQTKFCHFRRNHQTFRRSFAISEKIIKPSGEVLPFPKKSSNLQTNERMWVLALI